MYKLICKYIPFACNYHFNCIFCWINDPLNELNRDPHSTAGHRGKIASFLVSLPLSDCNMSLSWTGKEGKISERGGCQSIVVTNNNSVVLKNRFSHLIFLVCFSYFVLFLLKMRKMSSCTITERWLNMLLLFWYENVNINILGFVVIIISSRAFICCTDKPCNSELFSIIRNGE